MEQTNNKRFKRIKKLFNAKNFIVLIVVLMLCWSIQTINSKESNKEYQTTENITNIKVSNNDLKDSLKLEMIKEVTKHIKSKTSKSHQFIPAYLVHAGLSNDIDICFIMAQAQIETCYGTMGAGRESSRRSMFGISNKNYKNYEDAINHYCEVLKIHYMVKGKTEHHLMVKYVTAKGGRYAVNPRYEKELKLAYNSIKRSTKIYSLQQEYNRL